MGWVMGSGEVGIEGEYVLCSFGESKFFRGRLRGVVGVVVVGVGG